jgi:hypothetical protein
MDAVFLLKMRPALIHAAQMTNVLAEGDEIGEPLERRVEIGAKNLESLQDRGIFRIARRHGRNLQRRFRRFAVKMRAIALAVDFLLCPLPFPQ